MSSNRKIVILLLTNVLASAFMTGVIWFVQVVHYPLFAEVGSENFIEYERQHANRTGYVVAPVMLVELAAAAALAYMRPNAATLAALAMLGIIWLSTFGLQVPCHNRLHSGFDARVHARLLGSNWLRTVLWTARTCLVVVLLVKSLPGR